MDIKAIRIKTFLKKSDSIYKNIVIVSSRARQIIADRYQEFAVEEDIEDSDQLVELLDDIEYDVEKPITVATSEFMNQELEWREPEEEVEEK
tara:strand:- start:1992 stop:2267 length:276 start_codon:yes stop_codon:yes gene_type:complete